MNHAILRQPDQHVGEPTPGPCHRLILQGEETDRLICSSRGYTSAWTQRENRFSFQVNSLHPLQAVPLDLCRVCSTLVLVVPRLLDLDLPAVPDKNTEFLRRSASCWVPWINKWCILGSSTRIHHGRTVYFLQRFPHVPRSIRMINEAKQSYFYNDNMTDKATSHTMAERK